MKQAVLLKLTTTSYPQLINGIRNDSVSVLAKVLRQRTNQEVPTTPMSRGEALDQLFEELSENL